MSSTTGYTPSAPVTDGPTSWVPEAGVEIWREVRSSGGTGDPPTRYDKVYPTQEKPA